MSERKLSNWIESYLEYTASFEPTDKLNFWCGLTAVSAVTKRQLYMRRVGYDLYPNLYVLIVADSAKARKSRAMRIAMDLLEVADSGVSFLTDNMTPEGLVRHLDRETTIYKDEAKGVKVQFDSHIVIYADELAETFDFDRTRATRFTMLLTSIYDSRANWRKTLSSEHQIKLKNLYPVFIAGTDPVNLKVLPEAAIGGLTGRMIYLYENKKKRPISWEDEDPEKQARSVQLYEYLKEDLAAIGTLKGKFNPTKDARAVFEDWYTRQTEITYNDRNIEAFHHRCHDTALKIASLLSLCQSNDLIVTVKHVLDGIDLVTKQIPEITQIVNWSPSNEFAQLRAKFIDMLRRNGGVGTMQLALKNLMIPKDTLLTLTSTLEAQALISVTALKGRAVIYKLLED